ELGHDAPKFYPLLKDRPGVESMVGFHQGSDRFLVQTREQEDGSLTSGRLACVDLKDPNRIDAGAAGLKTLVPTQPGRELKSTTLAGDKLALLYQTNLGNTLAIHDEDGQFLFDFWPGEHGLQPGMLSAVQYDWHAKKLRFNYENTLQAPREYVLDLESRQLEKPDPKEGKLDRSRFDVQRVEYVSKDGTPVPMILVSPKGLERNGDNPTLLYGYGGFEVSVNDLSYLRGELIPFLEAGGTIALPALRGGSELGDGWHQQGRLDQKQNVFDDFLAARQWLIDEGYTRSERLGAMGYSNGGMLVGAAITQEPEGFAAAVPGTGVHDALGFEGFSSGAAWLPEYGRGENPLHFEFLSDYSPYHNVPEARLPATLVYTGHHDTRVDPSHSWRFAAELEHKNTGDAPIFMRTNPDTGHFSNHDPERAAEEAAYRIGFLMHHLGMKAPS
ncbi:MAG: prolyl oligopeptidase family serine peptidase, partial [Myxococcota bacterium]